jgi:hypothetical protein
MSSNDSLADRIVSLCRQGKIPRKFRVRHVRAYLGKAYPESDLRTVLANYARDTGNYVLRGMPPLFKLIDRGLYEVL